MDGLLTEKCLTGSLELGFVNYKTQVGNIVAGFLRD
jgi:hypothetical protein